MSEHDEHPHPVGDDPAWSESYYFNFVDPDTKIGMFTRMGFRANDGWADGLHVVYLGGDRIAFTYARRKIDKTDQDLTVGGLSLKMNAAHKNWQIAYDGPAQDIADGAILVTPSKERPEGWFTPATLKMQIDFETLTAPHYAGSGRTGHFEQTGRATGQIEIGGDVFDVSGYGVRDKSWGPRSWTAREMGGNTKSPAAATEPSPFVTWFSINFGDTAAIGCSCFLTDGVMRGEGWIHKHGKLEDLNDIVIESTYQPTGILHETLRMTAVTAAGEKIVIDGNVLTICPTKIPMKNGATFVNEGLAEFTMGDLKGHGIAEYWHMVTR